MNEKFLLAIITILIVGIITVQLLPLTEQETTSTVSSPRTEITTSRASDSNSVTSVSVNVLNTLTQSKVVVP